MIRGSSFSGKEQVALLQCLAIVGVFNLQKIHAASGPAHNQNAARSLLLLLLENHAVPISLHPVMPEGIANGCHNKDYGSIENHPAEFSSLVNSKYSSNEQIEGRNHLIKKGGYGKKANRRQRKMRGHHPVSQCICTEDSARPIADGSRAFLCLIRRPK